MRCASTWCVRARRTLSRARMRGYSALRVRHRLTVSEEREKRSASALGRPVWCRYRASNSRSGRGSNRSPHRTASSSFEASDTKTDRCRAAPPGKPLSAPLSRSAILGGPNLPAVRDRVEARHQPNLTSPRAELHASHRGLVRADRICSELPSGTGAQRTFADGCHGCAPGFGLPRISSRKGRAGASFHSAEGVSARRSASRLSLASGRPETVANVPSRSRAAGKRRTW